MLWLFLVSCISIFILELQRQDTDTDIWKLRFPTSEMYSRPYICHLCVAVYIVKHHLGHFFVYTHLKMNKLAQAVTQLVETLR
jgi:hypothetical protein